jgi:hypothetical protein
MASIKQYDGSWRATIKRKGHGVLVRRFPIKNEAELWASEQERSIGLVGLPLSVETLQYRGKKSAKKGSAATMTAAMIVASTVFKYAPVILLEHKRKGSAATSYHY